MNNSYNVLSSNEGNEFLSGTSFVTVTDENDVKRNRIMETNNIYYTLLAENKMELVGLKKEEITKQIADNINSLNVIKCAVPFYPLAILIVGGFLIVVKIVRPDALVGNSWLGLVSATAAGEICASSIAIVEYVYNKKELKLLKAQLEALDKYSKEPLSINKPDCLEYNFDEDNEYIQKEINEIIDSCNKKRTRKKQN